jgi:hypothetical protein
MLTELNKQKPEFTVQDGAIRLSQVKNVSGGKNSLADFSQPEYQAAEGLTADMLTYLPGEEVVDFSELDEEHLAMIIHKWCSQRNQPLVEPVDPLYEKMLRDERLAEMQMACQNVIYEGVEVATSDGVKKFSLTMQDQINLLGLRNQLDKGCAAMPYHADGESVRLWSRDDLQMILQMADRHISYHRVYFSLLREWVRRTSYPDFLAINYGDALPEDLAKNMGGILEGNTGSSSRTMPEQRVC